MNGKVYKKDLADDYRICSYDRAGYGWSDPGPFPRTSKTIVEELKKLIFLANLSPPYVLVGHSFGGYNMMCFSKSFPNEVTGLVLIDSSHPEQSNWFPSVYPDFPNGLHRTRFVSTPKLPINYPYKQRNIAFHLMSTRKARNALRFESMNFEVSGQQVMRLGDLPETPLMVLTRGERAWPLSPAGDEYETSWVRLQNELTRMSRDTVHIVANFSGHFIHLDQPYLVKYAIKSMIEQRPCGGVGTNKSYVGGDVRFVRGEC